MSRFAASLFLQNNMNRSIIKGIWLGDGFAYGFQLMKSNKNDL
jgi:hypothetical protein